MSKETRKKLPEIYQFSTLDKYSFSERFLIRAADLAFYILIWTIGKTTRFEVEGKEHLEEVEREGKVPIYAFWHDRIFLATYFFRDKNIVVMTSQSFDGEYIARFIQRFGYGAARGSSTRGGIGALVKMIRLMREGLPMAFTIDGPKGPRYEAKNGACLLAKKTANPIIPLTFEAKSFWTINSWDKLQIPKPFTRAKVIIAKPIYLEKLANDAVIENKRKELQTKLDELTTFGEQWRHSSNKFK